MITLLAAFALALPVESEANRASGWPDLSGRWARAVETSAASEVPVLGTVHSKTRALSLLVIEQEGPELRFEEVVCALETKTAKGILRGEFAPGFLRAASSRDRRAQLERSPRGLHYVEVNPPRVLGARLSQIDEPLPSTKADPRLRDDDGDGEPGLTVQIRGFISGELRVVERSRSRLVGQLRSAERIEGVVEWQAEQVVVDASRDALRTQLPTEPLRKRDANRFVMKKLARDADCARVLSAEIAAE